MKAARVQAGILLGHTAMDAVHAEFEELLRRARECADEDLHEMLLALREHLQSHFDQEDQWMRDSEFPAAQCHRDEHAAVLRSSNEVNALPAAECTGVGRRFVDELAGWFPAHAHYLDSALAAWLCKRQFGGRPVVLHPKKTSS